MSKTATRPSPRKLTMIRVYRQLQQLRQRVQDLEDLRDLNEAIRRNKGKPGTPWGQVKKELGL